MEEYLSEGAYDRKRKCASKQAILVPIKIRFTFTGVCLKTL